MSNKFPKRVKYEIIIVLLIFGASFLFPFCTFYYEGKSETHIIEKPQYINEFQIGFYYILFMVAILLALMTRRMVVLNVLNLLVLIGLLLTFIFIKLAFGWWGASPYHPTLSIGFALVNFTIIYIIIRSYFWIDIEKEVPLD